MSSEREEEPMEAENCLSASPNAALVTGAAGFIGSKLVAALQSGGMRVAGIDSRRGSSALERFSEIDITGPVTGEFFERDSVVFHLAGKVHSLGETKQDDAEYFRINTEGTKNVLEAAQRAGVNRFVFFSTIKAMSRDGVVGRRAESGKGEHSTSNLEHPTLNSERSTKPIAGGRQPESGDQRPDVVTLRAFSEADCIEPDTPYGKSKLEAEKLVLHGGYVPEPVVLRLCMVYGPGAKGNMQKMLTAVSQHRFPPLPEVGNRRSMVHVQDVLQAAILASEHPRAVGQVFIVSDGCAYSTRQVYQLMCQALGKRPAGWSIPLPCLRALGWAGDAVGRLRGRRFIFDSDAFEKLVGNAWFSSNKIETMLGFRPLFGLQKALPEMVAELRQHPSSSNQ
jgi:nucleoside-diphosphate-sugar epimerase